MGSETTGKDSASSRISACSSGLVARRGFAVLTGPAGGGKTILLGHLCSQLHPSTHRIVYVACSEYGPNDLLGLSCAGLDLVGFGRGKAEPMVRGLFPKAEQDIVLSLLGCSVVFLTPDSIEPVLMSCEWLSSA